MRVTWRRWLLVAGMASSSVLGCDPQGEDASPSGASATGGGAGAASGGGATGGAGGAATGGAATGGAATGGAATGGAATGGAATGGAATGGAAGSLELMHADFAGRAAGTYEQGMVAEDFGGTASWNNGLDEGRGSIVEEGGERFLRVTYAGGQYGPAAGGVQFTVPLGGAYDELYLAYRVRFAAGFDFVRGGKLPGLVGGTAPTGCVADEGGFSARGMWRPGGAAVQYLYYPEKVNACGDDFPYVIGGAPFAFVPGAWHQVEHHVALNRPGEHDGVLEAWVDGQLALREEGFFYRIAGATFGIDALYFSTFFGGSDATWAPATPQVADYDDFVVATGPIAH